MLRLLESRVSACAARSALAVLVVGSAASVLANPGSALAALEARTSLLPPSAADLGDVAIGRNYLVASGPSGGMLGWTRGAYPAESGSSFAIYGPDGTIREEREVAGSVAQLNSFSNGTATALLVEGWDASGQSRRPGVDWQSFSDGVPTTRGRLTTQPLWTGPVLASNRRGDSVAV